MPSFGVIRATCIALKCTIATSSDLQPLLSQEKLHRVMYKFSMSMGKLGVGSC